MNASARKLGPFATGNELEALKRGLGELEKAR
jgi:hypothetical protein